MVAKALVSSRQINSERSHHSSHSTVSHWIPHTIETFASFSMLESIQHFCFFACTAVYKKKTFYFCIQSVADVRLMRATVCGWVCVCVCLRQIIPPILTLNFVLFFSFVMSMSSSSFSLVHYGFSAHQRRKSEKSAWTEALQQRDGERGNQIDLIHFPSLTFQFVIHRIDWQSGSIQMRTFRMQNKTRKKL